MNRILQKYYIIFFVTPWMLLNAQVQESMLTIQEVDLDGNYLTTQNEIREDYIDNKVADINSTLHIKIKLEELVRTLSELKIDGLPIAMENRIAKLSTALQERNNVLSRFKILLEEYNYEQFKDDKFLNDQWVNTMQQLIAPVEALTQVDNFIEEGPGGFRPEDIYNRTSILLARMRSEAKIQAEEEGVYLQLGAWLNSEREPLPLHLPGFDRIAPQEYYEVERWQILPTPSQITALKKLQEIASKNRSQDLSIIRQFVLTELNRIKEVLFLDSKKLFENLEIELQKLSVSSYQEIITDIKKLSIDMELFLKTIDQKLSFYENLNLNSQAAIVAVLKQLETDLLYITEFEGKRLMFKLVDIYERVKFLSQNTEDTIQVAQELTLIISKYTTWLEIVNQDSLFKHVKILLQGTLVDFEALQFSNDVLKLMLSELPSKSNLDLHTVGLRQQGDRVLFKLVVLSPKEEVYVENREIHLYKILPHIEGTVGVIFADPLSHTSVQTQFQMAPYYNMLFKGIFDQGLRRKSVAYNKIFDWGIGLHISAPDFDGDDVPELGTGIVVSALHDYLQSGIAINVFTGDPYWFFGLRLPVPSFSISTLSN
ncbi:hypothetical protein ACE939_05955 [Aquimarina sp. W85]|uniref:hypothetical protein n=1 Tax=Aquimarina rhodophyticola TaxID=3342246 RepID=UPI003672ED97